MEEFLSFSKLNPVPLLDLSSKIFPIFSNPLSIFSPNLSKPALIELTISLNPSLIVLITLSSNLSLLSFLDFTLLV